MDMQVLLKIIKDGFIWWGHGLLAWLPEAFTQQFQLESSIQCIVDDEQVSLIFLNKRGVQKDRLSFSLLDENRDKTKISTWLKRYKKQDIVLVIPEQDCLVATLKMPAQAKDNLAEMIQFEIDRQTPFSSEQVHHGYYVQPPDDEPSTALTVTLAVVTKVFVTEQLARLSLPITSLLLQDKTQADICIPLTVVQTSSTDLFRLNILLSGLMVILAMMWFYKPVVHYQQAFDLIQADISATKKQALQVRKLIQQNESMVERIQFVDTKLLDYRLRLDILEELSQLLPQHTWLERSEFNGNKLSLFGRSSTATELIPLLTNSGHFEAVRFTAPLTHDPQSNKDRFRIEALIVSREDVNDGI